MTGIEVKILVEKIFEKIFEKIGWVSLLLLVVVFLIVLKVEAIPPDLRINVFLIVLLSVVCVIVSLFLLLNGISFGNISELMKFLKREDVQKSISELEALPDVIKNLKMEIIGKLKIIKDYHEYLKTKKINSVWVLGASLRNCELIKSSLEKNIKCEYLCTGERSVIISNARKLINSVGTEIDRYISSGTIEIYYIKSQLPSQFSRTFYNAEEGGSEILIFFPNAIESIIGKNAILLKDETAIQVWTEEYLKIKDTYGEKIDLAKVKEVQNL